MLAVLPRMQQRPLRHWPLPQLLLIEHTEPSAPDVMVEHARVVGFIVKPEAHELQRPKPVAAVPTVHVAQLESMPVAAQHVKPRHLPDAQSELMLQPLPAAVKPLPAATQVKPMRV